MPARLFFVLICAALLSACSDYSGAADSKPKMKQVAHTNPMGQTTYSYEPVNQ